MVRIMRSTALCLVLLSLLLLSGVSQARASHIGTRSAILIDAADAQVLYEQNADELIPPASVTKILTLYLIFDAIKQGEVHPWDQVRVSCRAANTGGSRMGLRAGREVSLEELVKGIAVVSGNDAAVAAAEHLGGSVENFVGRMNAKARQLGMTSSEFKTPNGLPAKDQVTTARDLARLSRSYIQHYPEALHIHSMTSYTYGRATHHNANRLLGACPGVDGIKTGFVCASGFNLAATAKRGDVRLIAVVMGARAPWVRTVETQKLLEAGFQKMAPDLAESGSVEEILAKREAIGSGRNARLACAIPAAAMSRNAAHSKPSRVHKNPAKVQGGSKLRNNTPSDKHARMERKASDAEDACPAAKQSRSGKDRGTKPLVLVKQAISLKKTGAMEKPEAPDRAGVKKTSTTKDATALKNTGPSKKHQGPEKTCTVQIASKASNGGKQKPSDDPPKKSAR